MDLRYLRFDAFTRVREHFGPRARKQRMQKFTELAGLREGMRVVDLGGAPEIWETVSCPLDITILNLPGRIVQAPGSHHKFTYVEGDACNATMFRDGQFDLTFSNSVIEHVGPPDKQVAFAREVSRLAPSYWVQTPSIWFPIEAHSGVPFWWFLPDGARNRMLDRWRAKLPAWTEMIETTRVLMRTQMQDLFPDAQMIVEHSFGFPKSYTVYRLAS